MPLFVYRCSEGHEFEKLIRSGEPPASVKCTRCVDYPEGYPALQAELVPARVSPFQWGRGGSWK